MAKRSLTHDTAAVFTPPPHIVKIAKERTRPIVRQWSCEILFRPADFMVLAESCYMQGMNDMIDAALRAGWSPEVKPLNLGDMP